MDLDFLIDHMKRKLPMSDKVGNAIVAELEKSRELQSALKPLVLWWKTEKKLEEKFGSFSDCVLGFTHKGEISNKVTANQLDAIARLVGEE